MAINAVWMIAVLFCFGLDQFCPALTNLGRVSKTAPVLFFL